MYQTQQLTLKSRRKEIESLPDTQMLRILNVTVFAQMSDKTTLIICIAGN